MMKNILKAARGKTHYLQRKKKKKKKRGQQISHQKQCKPDDNGAKS